MERVQHVLLGLFTGDFIDNISEYGMRLGGISSCRWRRIVQQLFRIQYCSAILLVIFYNCSLIEVKLPSFVGA